MSREAVEIEFGPQDFDFGVQEGDFGSQIEAKMNPKETDSDSAVVVETGRQNAQGE